MAKKLKLQTLLSLLLCKSHWRNVRYEADKALSANADMIKKYVFGKGGVGCKTEMVMYLFIDNPKRKYQKWEVDGSWIGSLFSGIQSDSTSSSLNLLRDKNLIKFKDGYYFLNPYIARQLNG